MFCLKLGHRWKKFLLGLSKYRRCERCYRTEPCKEVV
jgi:hypothetical protein